MGYILLLILLFMMPFLVSLMLHHRVRKSHHLWLLLYSTVIIFLVLAFSLPKNIGGLDATAVFISIFITPLLPWVLYAYRWSIKNEKYQVWMKILYYVVFMITILTLWMYCLYLSDINVIQ